MARLMDTKYILTLLLSYQIYHKNPFLNEKAPLIAMLIVVLIRCYFACYFNFCTSELNGLAERKGWFYAFELNKQQRI